VKQAHRHVGRRRLPPFKAIHAYEAVVRLGSMVAAAAELGVTHGAISKQIGLLEDLLGRPLLERTPSGMRPTQEGAAYADELREALDRISRASRRLFEGPGQAVPLRVLAPATFAMQWLIPNLRRAGLREFEDQIAIYTTQTHEPWTGSPFDLAIRRGRKDCAGQDSQPLWTEELTLICAPVIARRLRAEGLASLTDEPLVESVSRPDELPSWLVRAGINPSSVRVRQRYDHFYVTLQAIINGYGCGVGSLQVLEHEITAGRIEAPFPDLTTPGVEYQLVRPPAVDHPLAEKFATWLFGATTTSAATIR
jgi:LysR family transcriptional regulator, glycine cleavage system transcriptional activator